MISSLLRIHHLSVLKRCDPALLVLSDEGDELDSAGEKLLFLQDKRRVQKVLWRQLFVLDSMMCELEGLQSPQQLLTQNCAPQTDSGARGRWKALKAECRRMPELTEELLATLLQKIQTINDKRQKFTQLLQQLQAKKQQSEDMQTHVEKKLKALQTCDGQLNRLRAQLGAEIGRVDGWQCSKEAFQIYAAAVREVAHVNLLSFNETEVTLELKPRLLANTNPLSNQLEPLKLSVIWSPDDRFTLEVDPARSASQIPEDASGRCTELSAVLLDAVHNYVGQADLLAEIQSLRTSFAIDWHPAQRLLVYLKSASILCHLEVQEGYPDSGAVHLRGVQRDGIPLNIDTLQPLNPDGSLTQWLIFLSTNPLI
ncbi:uncharacterized protein si:dkey-225f5.4 isoform X2 [Corythoichthys intestinalis]|uniref:uncharacterized protein si:dkey-225f5.4 isoform X2 n=1 Tax=Corythoichthys intestinalis TaxID=161448 RepID=UPI0025A5FF31|nr:uncharacterized protein si:dkey-225f5.4 isoform X2 [Corythoichthys intestinalis]